MSDGTENTEQTWKEIDTFIKKRIGFEPRRDKARSRHFRKNWRYSVMGTDLTALYDEESPDDYYGLFYLIPMSSRDRDECREIIEPWAKSKFGRDKTEAGIATSSMLSALMVNLTYGEAMALREAGFTFRALNDMGNTDGPWLTPPEGMHIDLDLAYDYMKDTEEIKKLGRKLRPENMLVPDSFDYSARHREDS